MKHTTVIRRLLAIALAGVLGALVLPAGAAPSVNRVGGAEAHLNLYGSDRMSYLIDIVAKVSEAGLEQGTGVVAVTIRRCGGYKCSKAVTYRAKLTGSQLLVADDMTSGSLFVSLFGKPLSLSWGSPTSQPLVAYEARPDGNPRAVVRTYRTTLVDGSVAGRPCSGKEAMLSHQQGVDDAAAVAPAALPRTAPREFAGMLKGTCQSVM